MAYYLITETGQILDEIELEKYFYENITEYTNISDWIFDSIRYGLLQETF